MVHSYDLYAQKSSSYNQLLQLEYLRSDYFELRQPGRRYHRSVYHHEQLGLYVGLELKHGTLLTSLG